ncbi:sporulation protein YjcZ [Brevibacillus choshinensis]|nr:sporulation protein YjcZ [Brevibacillus choshinensis]
MIEVPSGGIFGDDISLILVLFVLLVIVACSCN